MPQTCETGAGAGRPVDTSNPDYRTRRCRRLRKKEKKNPKLERLGGIPNLPGRIRSPESVARIRGAAANGGKASGASEDARTEDIYTGDTRHSLRNVGNASESFPAPPTSCRLPPGFCRLQRGGIKGPSWDPERSGSPASVFYWKLLLSRRSKMLKEQGRSRTFGGRTLSGTQGSPV